MNNGLLMMMALMGGGGMNPQIVEAMMNAQKDNFERWSKLLQVLGAIIITGIFYMRGMPAPVDEGGRPVFTNEALSKQIAASFSEGKREAFWVSVINGVVAALTEFLRPSAVQQALFTSLLNRPATPSTTTTIMQPASSYAAASAPSLLPMPMTTISQTRSAGQVLRSGASGSMVRAQAVYYNPQTGEMAVE